MRRMYDENEIKSIASGGGGGGGSKTYLHAVKISDANGLYNLYFNIYSSKETLTLDDALAQLPSESVARIPVTYTYITYIGVLSAAKSEDGKISVSGVVFDRENNTAKTYTNNNLVPGKITDTLLGEI